MLSSPYAHLNHLYMKKLAYSMRKSILKQKRLVIIVKTKNDIYRINKWEEVQCWQKSNLIRNVVHEMQVDVILGIDILKHIEAWSMQETDDTNNERSDNKWQ